MGKIFMIIGPSSSGKDTVYKVIKSYYPELKPIITYTTRPIRENEKDGQEYFFITDEQLDNMIKNNEILEKREYNTKYGIWKYATSCNNINLEKYDYLTINTLEAYNSLKEYYGKDSIIPIYIRVADNVRLERAIKREKEEANPKFDELKRRFEADKLDFSYKKLVDAGITEYYDNEILGLCINKIRNKINYELFIKEKKKKFEI